MIQEAQFIIDRLGLEKHPEGGYYRETYRSEESIVEENLPARFAGGPRSFSTAIYFFLVNDEFSALHRIQSDEIWHYHAGATLVIHVLDEKGRYARHKLGGDCSADVSFQVVVKAGSWFGASLEKPETFALVGCTVSPGFDFRDFEMADRRKLLRLYPENREIIEMLTR
jgi:predicted cupin superfamily sugar epimerase